MIQLNDKELAAARKALLENIKDSSLSDADCEQCLERALQDFSEIFEPYEDREDISPQVEGAVRWTAEYFAKAKTATRQNFSEERLRHLLAVRKELRRRGVKGFVYQPDEKGSHAVNKHEDVNSSEVSIGRMLLDGADKAASRLQAELILAFQDADNSNADLEKTLELLTQANSEVCEPYQVDVFNKAIVEDSVQWDANYFYSQMAYLRTNFSKERFMHLLDVRKHLQAKGVEGFVPSATASKPAAKPAKTALPTNDVHKKADAAIASRSSTKSDSENQASYGDGFDPVKFFQLALLVGAAIAATVLGAIFFRK